MRSTLLLAALFVTTSAAQAADFGFSTLIRMGNPGIDWELGSGAAALAPSVTSSLSSYWNSGASRQFQITYNRPTNNVELRLWTNSGSSSTALNFTPSGTPNPIDAIWTLPASSFFVKAVTGANVWTGITLSSMTLSGVSGALNVISPMLQTSLQAGSSLFQPTQTVTQTGDVVFRGDSNGSWRLAGYVTMNYFGLGGLGHQDRLTFGLTALSAAAPTPEPSTGLMLAAGVAFGLWWRKRQ